MPTVTEAPTRAYAFCRDARCAGYQEQEVDAFRVETAQTYGENGGDGVFIGMIERSAVSFRFANESQVPCPACKTPREVTGTPRPSYQSTGYDPLGLLGGMKFDASMVIPPGEDKTAELEAQVAKLTKLVEGMAETD